MKYKRTPLFLDKLDLTLSIERSDALEIYERVEDHFDVYDIKPWKPKGPKERYKYRYRISISDTFYFFLYTIPIGEGQSSIKLEFNPFYLTPELMKTFRKALVKLLGREHCLRLFREANVTRIDLAVDFEKMLLSDYHYFCVGSHSCDDEHQTTLELGSKKSKNFWRIYEKHIEQNEKIGHSDHEHPVLRFEWVNRARVTMGQLKDIPSSFDKLHAYDFNANDPEFRQRFIDSRVDNRDLRSRFIRRLKNECLHAAIRHFEDGSRNVILTALKPYRIDLFPDRDSWSRELDRALGYLQQLIPRDERPQLKHRVPSSGNHHFSHTVMCAKGSGLHSAR